MRNDNGDGDIFCTDTKEECCLRDRLCSMLFSEFMSYRVPTGFINTGAHHQLGKGGVRMQKLISLLLMFLLIVSCLGFIACEGPVD